MGCTQLKGQQYEKQLHKNSSTEILYSRVNNHNTEEPQSRNAPNNTAYTGFTLGRTQFTLANSKEPQRAGTDALISSEYSRVRVWQFGFMLWLPYRWFIQPIHVSVTSRYVKLEVVPPPPYFYGLVVKGTNVARTLQTFEGIMKASVTKQTMVAIRKRSEFTDL